MGHARRKEDPRQLGLRYPEKKVPTTPTEAAPAKPREIAATAPAPESMHPPAAETEDPAAEDRAEKIHDAGGFRRDVSSRAWRRRS